MAARSAQDDKGGWLRAALRQGEGIFVAARRMTKGARGHQKGAAWRRPREGYRLGRGYFAATLVNMPSWTVTSMTTVLSSGDSSHERAYFSVMDASPEPFAL